MPGLYSMSIGKDVKFKEALHKAGLREEYVDAIVRNPDLMQYWVSNLIHRVQPITYTDLSTCVDRIMKRSDMRGWGFTGEHADGLRRQLRGIEHDGQFRPVGIRIWRGRDLAYNWAESLAWLEDEARAKVFILQKFFNEEPSFLPGSEISGDLSLTPVGLIIDQGTWHTKGGMFVNKVLPSRSHWPSLEVSDLLCLNNHLMFRMEGCSFPRLAALGLVVAHNNSVGYGLGGNGFGVSKHWRDYDWGRHAAVGYREL